LTNDQKGVKHYQEQRECVFGHNVLYHVCGILFLWFGWYGFTCGRTLGATNIMQVASKVAVTTTLSAATSGLTVLSFERIVEGVWSIPRFCDGILCGLVAISSPCNVIDCGYSILIGFLAAVVYYSIMWLCNIIKYDDPLNTFVIHGMCGGFGLLAAGLFATGDTVRFGYSTSSVPHLIEANTGHRFATQIVGMLVISIWTMLNCLLVFGFMHLCSFFRENPKNDNVGDTIQMAQTEDDEKNDMD